MANETDQRTNQILTNAINQTQKEKGGTHVCCMKDKVTIWITDKHNMYQPFCHYE